MSYLKNSKIVDGLGNEVEVGLFGGLKVSNASPQISLTFDHPLSSRRVKTSGSPQAQFNRSLLKVSGDTNDVVRTMSALRYKTAQTIETYFTAGFNGTYTSGTTYIGLYDVYDGVFIGYKDGDFVVGYRNVFGSSTASWDGTNVINPEPDVLQVVSAPVNVDKITRYRIRFGYLGVGNISYEYFDGDKWVLLHTFKTDNNLLDRTHVGSAVLTMKCESSHAGCFVLSGSWNAQTYGNDTGLQDEPFFSDGERAVAGDVAGLPVVAFRSMKTFGNYPNKVRSRLLNAEFSTGSEGLYKIEMYIFPEGTISGTWTAIDSGSVLEYNDTVNLVDITGGLAAGRRVFSTNLAVPSSGTGVASVSLDFEKLGVKANPTDEYVIVKRELVGGAGDAITSWSIAYQDLF